MLSFLYVYSDHSILECYNLFSGVELSMRSFFVISMHGAPHVVALLFVSVGIDISTIPVFDRPLFSPDEEEGKISDWFIARSASLTR